MTHHQLHVRLHPVSQELIVTDRISFSNGRKKAVSFRLNKGLKITGHDGSLELISSDESAQHDIYRIVLPEPSNVITLSYEGTVQAVNYTGMGGMPRAVISAEGVYLDSGSAWYPVFGGQLDGFSMNVALPEAWQSISQGRRSEKGGIQNWKSNVPEQEIYLLAGPFTRYSKKHEDLDLSVYLLDADDRLADTYLSLMGEYIEQYSAMIGPYPFPKFAVVENRWQTGYGMPSFTLLGSHVIRLPFIPYTSLPHEILHNWWGNGVWIDYSSGNWSEGLTAYLADHHLKELKGEGTEYRRKALQRYVDFASEKRDAPLAAFTARHSDASQAIGYSKSLMLFHMLRQEIGHKAFHTALAKFWRERQFTSASFLDLLETFSSVTGTPLDHYRDWLFREGAPVLEMTGVNVEKRMDGHKLHFTVRQSQQADPFRLSLPVAVTMKGEPYSVMHGIQLDQRVTKATLELPAAPLRLDIDPLFETIRILDSSERPPALGQLFGSKRLLLVIPGSAEKALQDAWRQLAASWKQRYGEIETVLDDELESVPDNRELFILGWNNALLPEVASRFKELQLNNQQANLENTIYSAGKYSIVLMGASRENAIGFIGAATPEAIAAMARKLPHYSTYGRLVFDGISGKNQVKKSAPIADSVMTYHFTDSRVDLKLPIKPLGE